MAIFSKRKSTAEQFSENFERHKQRVKALYDSGEARSSRYLRTYTAEQVLGIGFWQKWKYKLGLGGKVGRLYRSGRGKTGRLDILGGRIPFIRRIDSISGIYRLMQEAGCDLPDIRKEGMEPFYYIDKLVNWFGIPEKAAYMSWVDLEKIVFGKRKLPKSVRDWHYSGM